MVIKKGIKYRFLIWFIFLFNLFSAITCDAGVNKFEGYFSNHEYSQLHLISVFLPYNPRILLETQNQNLLEECQKEWPFGIITNFQDASDTNEVDLIWLDLENNKRSILNETLSVNSSNVIYITNFLTDDGRLWNQLKSNLIRKGFTLLSRWYSEGACGNAIFLKKNLFQSAMHSWNYNANGNISSIPVVGKPSLESFFKSFESKKYKCGIEGIDFIYMINLDQRPRKFERAQKHLKAYGIKPSRFSAVNGWELPVNVIRELGVPYRHEMTNESFMGTVYKNIDGALCVSNEKICKEGEIYFSLGMSRGAIGIVLSHLSVLQNAFDAGYQTIWVMEDDVEVVGNPDKIPQYLKLLDQIDESWDVLFTDPDTRDFEGNYIPCRSLGARPNYSMENLDFFLTKFGSVSDELMKVGMRYGAYSMILSRSGIEKILNYFKTYRVFLPYDMDFWLIKDLRMYAPKEGIVSHCPGAPTDNGTPNYLKECD